MSPAGDSPDDFVPLTEAAPAAQLLRSREPALHLSGDEAERLMRRLGGGAGMQTALLLPMRLRESVRHVLVLADAHQRDFDTQALEVARAFADAAEAGLAQLELAAEHAAQTARQAALARAARTLNESLELNRVLVRICEEAASILGSDYANVFLGNASEGLRFEATAGLPPEVIGAHINPGEGLVGKCIERDEPMLTNDYQALPRQVSLAPFSQGAQLAGRADALGRGAARRGGGGLLQASPGHARPPGAARGLRRPRRGRLPQRERPRRAGAGRAHRRAHRLPEPRGDARQPAPRARTLQAHRSQPLAGDRGPRRLQAREREPGPPGRRRGAAARGPRPAPGRAHLRPGGPLRRRRVRDRGDRRRRAGGGRGGSARDRGGHARDAPRGSVGRRRRGHRRGGRVAGGRERHRADRARRPCAAVRKAAGPPRCGAARLRAARGLPAAWPATASSWSPGDAEDALWSDRAREQTERLRKRTRQLALANAHGARVAALRDPAELVEAAVEELHRGFEYFLCALLRLRDDGYLESVAARGLGLERVEGGRWSQPRGVRPDRTLRARAPPGDRRRRARRARLPPRALHGRRALRAVRAGVGGRGGLGGDQHRGGAAGRLRRGRRAAGADSGRPARLGAARREPRGVARAGRLGGHRRALGGRGRASRAARAARACSSGARSRWAGASGWGRRSWTC